MQRFSSIFSQLLQLFPRLEFQDQSDSNLSHQVAQSSSEPAAEPEPKKLNQ